MLGQVINNSDKFVSSINIGCKESLMVTVATDVHVTRTVYTLEPGIFRKVDGFIFYWPICPPWQNGLLAFR